MFARKKTTQPCEQTSHLWAAMFIWDFGRSRCEVESLQISFITAGEIQPYGGGWPRTRMREWELNPGTGKSTVASLVLIDG